MSEILGGIAIAKGAIEATKGAVDLFRAVSNATTERQRKEALSALQAKLFDVQAKLFELQEKQFEHRETVAELEATIAAYDHFNEISSQYELRQFHGGAVLYCHKADEVGSGVSHFVCTNCFEKRKRSILQPTGELVRRDRHYRCPDCRAEVVVGPPITKQETELQT